MVAGLMTHKLHLHGKGNHVDRHARAASNDSGSGSSDGWGVDDESLVHGRTMDERSFSRRYAELRVAASGLRSTGPLEVFAVVQVKEKDAAVGHAIGATETVIDDPNPNFVSSFAIECDSISDMERTVSVLLYDKHHRRVMQRAPALLGKVEFPLARVLNSHEKCLDLPVSNDSSKGTGGLIFVSVEEIRYRSQARDMVTMRFSLGQNDYGSSLDSYFFTVSRELKCSSGQWNRVYRSPPLSTGIAETRNRDQTSHTATISTSTLYSDNIDRRILVELYRVPLSSGRGVEHGPILCGCVRTTIRALQNCQKLARPLYLECEPESNMAAGRIVLDQGTFITGEKGQRMALLFSLSGVKWFHSETERQLAIQRNSFVDTDSWGRKERTIVGGLIGKSWKGSAIDFRWLPVDVPAEA